MFEPADMMDTKVDAAKTDDTAAVAEIGFKAIMIGLGRRGQRLAQKAADRDRLGDPSSMLAEMHRRMAQPGTAKQ